MTATGQPGSLNSNPADDEQKAKRKQWERRRQARLMVLLPLLLVIVGLVWTYTTNFIPSSSMLPTLKPGDHILTMKAWIAYPGGRMPARGDIIVFRLSKKDRGEEDSGDAPADDNADAANSATKAEILIKRVVGLPGESVQVVNDGDVLINGQKMEMDYPIVRAEAPNEAGYRYAVGEPIVVPPGQLFVLGDNRDNSDDGRFWGTLKRKDVLGKFVRVLFHEKDTGPNAAKAAAEKEQGQ